MIGTIKPQYNDIHFSGHESFPCRTLWLKKGYDFIKSNGNFNADDAVVTLGVGKNMVSAIRYWYKVFGFNSEKFGWIADYLFDNNNGKDKYLEDLATLWLLHFLIVYYNDATLYNVFFAMFQRERKVFDREHILNFVKRKLVEAQKETAFNENLFRFIFHVCQYILKKKPPSTKILLDATSLHCCSIIVCLKSRSQTTNIPLCCWTSTLSVRQTRPTNTTNKTISTTISTFRANVRLLTKYFFLQ